MDIKFINVVPLDVILSKYSFVFLNTIILFFKFVLPISEATLPHQGSERCDLFNCMPVNYAL